MKNTRNNNSVLILATLGVYLGLVLVGATPQVLAQAAMTRQFNVKDEIEFKEDLEKKPDRAVADDDQDPAVQTGHLVSLSIDKFLSGFAAVGPLSNSPILVVRAARIAPAKFDTLEQSISKLRSLRSAITVANLPRAGLDSLPAIDAK